MDEGDFCFGGHEEALTIYFIKVFTDMKGNMLEQYKEIVLIMNN